MFVDYEIAPETMKKAKALHIIVQSSVKRTLLKKESQFVRDMLPYVMEPYKLVEDINKFYKYKDFIDCRCNEIWNERTGKQYNRGPAISPDCYNENGTIKQKVIEDILNEQSSTLNKNGIPHRFGKKLLEIKKAPKSVLGTTIFPYFNTASGTEGNVVRQLLLAKSSFGDLLLLAEMKTNYNSPKISIDVKLLYNGVLEGGHYLGRFDTIGFASKRYLEKHQLPFVIPQEILAEAEARYDHENMLPKNRPTSLSKTALASTHFHFLDDNLEYAKALLQIYQQLVPQDVFSKPIIKDFKRRFNAETVNLFHDNKENQAQRVKNQNLHLNIVKANKGQYPAEIILQSFYDNFNVDENAKQVLGENALNLIDLQRNVTIDFNTDSQNILANLVGNENYGKENNLA